MADLGILKAKTRQILRVAALNGRTHLVLGAIGCGYLKNPPKRVAQTIKDVLTEPEWDGRFEDITFAVLDTQNEGNFRVFRDIIGRRRHTADKVKGQLKKLTLRGGKTYPGAFAQGSTQRLAEFSSEVVESPSSIIRQPTIPITDSPRRSTVREEVTTESPSSRTPKSTMPRADSGQSLRQSTLIKVESTQSPRQLTMITTASVQNLQPPVPAGTDSTQSLPRSSLTSINSAQSFQKPASTKKIGSSRGRGFLASRVKMVQWMTSPITEMRSPFKDIRSPFRDNPISPLSQRGSPSSPVRAGFHRNPISPL